MAVAATDQVMDTISALKEAANMALSAENAEQFTDFEKHVNEVEAYVREVQQSMWANEAKNTIKNLEKDAPLTPTDQAVLRAFIVSDAERYLAHENNYGDWKRELQRLMDDLMRRANTVDRDTIGDIRGVLKDAIRLVPDIRNYLEERQRVEKFEQAINVLDGPSRDMLARLIKEQLGSSKR
jgi:hypothetical protein